MAAPMDSAIENYVKGFEDSAAKYITQGFLDRQLSLLTFIENLGVYLTSTDASSRARATRLIADVLQTLPVDFLTQSEAGLLTTFLGEKLADHHSIHSHALNGLLALVKCVNLTEEMVGTICRTVFREVHTQSLPQGDRRIVFNLFYTLLTSRLKDVQKLEGDFVYGYMQAMDSEKDPRNLTIAFASAQLVIQNLSLGVFVEEFFEVVSCYFPIDFTPSGNDPSGIKKEDLILSLRRCMAASPHFAQYCLPLLMEKLTSDLKSAKIDALETLTVCTQTYSPESLNEFQSSLFNCIKKEVFLSGDVKIEDAALDTLQALVRVLSTGISQSDRRKSYDGFVEEILHEAKNHLLQPELMLMLSSGRLLQAAAKGSETACCLIVKTVIPMLIETFNKQKQATPKYNVIVVINGFLECTVNFKFSGKNSNPIIASYKDHVFAIYTEALHSDVTSLSIQSIKGFHMLLTLPSENLLETERSFIATKLVQVVINAALEHEVRSVAIEALQFIIATYPDTGEKYILPVLFSTVKNESMEIEGTRTITHHQALEVLSMVTCEPRTVQCVTDQLVPLLNQTESLDFYQALTECMSKICEKCAHKPDALPSLHKGVNSIHQLVEQSCHRSEWSNLLSDETVLKNLASCLRHVAINWTPEIKTEVQSLFIKSYLGCGTKNNFAPLKNATDAKFVCLFTPVICSDTTKSVIPNEEEITSSLVQLLDESLSQPVNQSVCKCLAGILNKAPAGDHLDSILSNLKTAISNAVNSGKTIPTNKVQLLSWITKAIVLRNHPMGTELCSMLFSLLSSPVVGKEAAKGFYIILSEFEDVLNKSMRANIRMMYRQRFFQENLSTVISGYKHSRPENQENYLLCLSYMIKDLTRQVLIPELPKIYPLLIQSLLCNDLDLQLATMTTMADLIENAPDLVDKQLDSLLPQLLKLTRYESFMKVRIASLDCLNKLTKLPANVIMPHLKTVTRALLPVLDDKKRLVRAKAADTRLEWFLLETENK